ncbi:MAG: hypothetical protein ACRENK_15535 [Gemmatimonadaceae bacterium]
MIQLIVYAVLAFGLLAGAIGAWHSVQHSIAAPFVAAQIKQDQAAVDSLTAQLVAAKKQGADALADVASCEATAKTQSDLVDLWQGTAAANLKRARAAEAAGQASHQVAQTAIARYQEIASRPPVKDETCEQKLAKTDKLLRDAARALAAAKAGK